MFLKLNFNRRTPAFRAAGVLCVLLALVTGFIGAFHVHPASANAADSSCPTCALLHAGAVPVEFGHTAPILFASTSLDEVAEASPNFTPPLSLYIRPPPLV
jgi:hypothetical protein